MTIDEYVHTEIHNGNIIIDSYVAQSDWFVKHFMKIWKKNRIRKIKTSYGLRFTLAWNGKIMRNIIIQVVQFDIGKLY